MDENENDSITIDGEDEAKFIKKFLDGQGKHHITIDDIHLIIEGQTLYLDSMGLLEMRPE